MKHLKKSLLLTLSLGVSCIATDHAHAATSTKIHPISNAMVSIINNAPDANTATQELCKQKGVLRGSGFSAGSNCKLQDLARVALVGCSGYKNGKDSFAGSNCEKEAKKVGITEVARAADLLRLAVQADVGYTTNAKFLICGPDALPDVGAYRQKLPAGLRQISDAACPATTLKGVEATKVQPPARPTSLPPVGGASQINTPPEPIELSSMVQSALRDLAPLDATDLQSLFEGQHSLLGVISDLNSEEQKLQAVNKSDPMLQQIKQEQLAALADYKDIHQVLDSVNIQIKAGKPLDPTLLQKVRTVAKKMKDKPKKNWHVNPLYVGK